MLIQSLTAHFRRWFDRAAHHTTVLWFDPNEEYAALLNHLTDIELWHYEGSLLELRYRLIHRAPDERTVVYLPLSQDEAEILRPFFATSLIFRDRLYKFLRKQGLDFPDDPETKHQLRSLLPRLAARSVGKGRSFWEYNLANLERARETLLGNFDDTLLQFLAGPRTALANLQREQLDGLFSAQLESAYGFSASPEDDAETIARRLTAQLILTYVYRKMDIFLQEHGHEIVDFPYIERVADPVYRPRCATLVMRWQNSVQYVAAYVRLAEMIQSHYDLTRWIMRLPKDLYLTVPASFPNVQEAQWEAAQTALAGLVGTPQRPDRRPGRRPMGARGRRSRMGDSRSGPRHSGRYRHIAGEARPVGVYRRRPARLRQRQPLRRPGLSAAAGHAERFYSRPRPVARSLRPLLPRCAAPHERSFHHAAGDGRALASER